MNYFFLSNMRLKLYRGNTLKDNKANILKNGHPVVGATQVNPNETLTSTNCGLWTFKPSLIFCSWALYKCLRKISA